MKRSAGKTVAVILLLVCLLAAAILLAVRSDQARRARVPAPSPEPEEAETAAVVETPEPVAVLPEECGHPSYINGVCTVCGEPCPHPFHDEEGHCLRCGKRQPHSFYHGVCTVCGARPELCEHLLPPRFYQPDEKAGRVESWSYETVEPSRALDVTRRMCIYTPYGYDPEKQYNVLVLLHGLRSTEESWLTSPCEIEGTQTAEMRWIYDRMIDERIIEPLIIVCPSQYMIRGEHLYKTTYEQMAQELQEIILPYVAEHYSTFAVSGEREALIAAREHFALGGNSWGSYYTYDTGMCQCLPFFSSFLCFSGDAASGYVVESLESAALRDYPIDLYYSAGGQTDVALKSEMSCFYAIVPLVERLHDGENAFFHVSEGGHDWRTWSIEIYNALQFLF